MLNNQYRYDPQYIKRRLHQDLNKSKAFGLWPLVLEVSKFFFALLVFTLSFIITRLINPSVFTFNYHLIIGLTPVEELPLPLAGPDPCGVPCPGHAPHGAGSREDCSFVLVVLLSASLTKNLISGKER